MRIIQKAKALYKRYGSEKIDFVVEKLGAEIYKNLATKNMKEVYYPELRAIAIKPNLHPYERKYLIAHALGPPSLSQGGLISGLYRSSRDRDIWKS